MTSPTPDTPALALARRELDAAAEKVKKLEAERAKQDAKTPGQRMADALVYVGERVALHETKHIYFRTSFLGGVAAVDSKHPVVDIYDRAAVIRKAIADAADAMLSAALAQPVGAEGLPNDLPAAADVEARANEIWRGGHGMSLSGAFILSVAERDRWHARNLQRAVDEAVAAERAQLIDAIREVESRDIAANSASVIDSAYAMKCAVLDLIRARKDVTP